MSEVPEDEVSFTIPIDAQLGRPLFTCSIIKQYLEDANSDAHTTAASLTAPLYEVSNADLATPDERYPTAYLHFIFAGIIHFAKQTPFQHPFQQRLVDLLHALQLQRPLPDRVSELICEERYLDVFDWRSLPTLGFQVNEIWHAEMPLWQDAGMREWSTQEWTNMNAFVSLMLAQTATSSGDGETRASQDTDQDAHTFGFEERGLELLKVVFEDADTKDDTNVVKNNLPAAVIWILTASDWLVANDTLSKDQLAQWKEKLDHLRAAHGSDDTDVWAGRAATYIGTLLLDER